MCLAIQVLKVMAIVTLVFSISDCGFGRGVHTGFDPGTDPNQPLSYEAVTSGTLTVTKIATLLAPTRLKISPDGTLMFAALQAGQVILFRKVNGNWQQQSLPFFELGALNAPIEGGLTGLFFGADFNPQVLDATRREIFLNYQIFDQQTFRNRITRVTLIEHRDNFIGVNPVTIYEGSEPAAGAHQIEDGIGFLYEGAPHILVAIGDGFVPEDALDPSVEGRGKLLLMQRDGSDPLGPRPYPESPKVQAIGIRNPYGLAILSAAVDPHRRVIGLEAGNDTNDRIWFLEVVDFDHEVDAPLSLGYDGDDTAADWLSIPDLNFPGAEKPEAVLAVLHPVITPMCIDLHPGGGVIPTPGEGRVVFVATYLGEIGSTANGPGKKVMLGVIDNLDAQPTLTLTPLIQRRADAEGTFGNTSALAVDPKTGDIIFADIVTGEVNQASLTRPGI